MKIDEDVPITIPKMIARPKPRMTSPPNSRSGPGRLEASELLHSEVAETERGEGLADRVDLECLRPAQFDDDDAAEIDPEIEALSAACSGARRMRFVSHCPKLRAGPSGDVTALI